jgi:hypothetical protein
MPFPLLDQRESNVYGGVDPYGGVDRYQGKVPRIEGLPHRGGVGLGGLLGDGVDTRAAIPGRDAARERRISLLGNGESL